MAQPSTAITRLDLSMTYTELSLRANRLKFGWMKILPPLLVGNLSQSDFPRINIKSLLEALPTTDVRSAYGDYPRDTFKWDKDSYNLQDHGLEESVDDQLIEMYGDIIDSEAVARMRAVDRVLRHLEQDVANMLFTSSWAHKTALGTPWSTKTSTPIDDLFAGIESVEDRTGVTPNKLVITDRSWRDLVLCNQLEDKLDSGSNDNPNQISTAGFLSLFDTLDEVVIVGGFNNTANKAQTPVLGRVWDSTMAMLCCVSDEDLSSNDLASATPHLGRTLFHQDGNFGALPGTDDDEQAVIVEEYREERRRGGVLRARNHRGVKILHQECAELLTGVSA